MKNVIFWGTFAAGVIAAYLMIRRGESPATAVRETVLHPIGSFVNEAQNAAAS